jgi:hypothetical protein
MSNPYDLLHGVTSSGSTARTRAKRECGWPVIHGSEIGIAVAGAVTVSFSYRIPPSRKRFEVESWNS